MISEFENSYVQEFYNNFCLGHWTWESRHLVKRWGVKYFQIVPPKFNFYQLLYFEPIFCVATSIYHYHAMYRKHKTSSCSVQLYSTVLCSIGTQYTLDYCMERVLHRPFSTLSFISDISAQKYGGRTNCSKYQKQQIYEATNNQIPEHSWQSCEFHCQPSWWEEAWEVPDCKVRSSPDGTDKEEAEGGDVDVWPASGSLSVRGDWTKKINFKIQKKIIFSDWICQWGWYWLRWSSWHRRWKSTKNIYLCEYLHAWESFLLFWMLKNVWILKWFLKLNVLEPSHRIKVFHGGYKCKWRFFNFLYF